MADYTTPFSNLGNLLGGLSANTPETPYSIEITSMSQNEFSKTNSSFTSINAVLKSNPAKYVEITVADSCECCTNHVHLLIQVFIDCTNLVGCDISNVRGKGEGQGLEETFQGCTSLKWVELPSNTTYLGGTFRGCTGLESIDLRGFYFNVYNAFEGCTGLTDVKIDLDRDDYSEVFKDCTSLTNIDGIRFKTGSYNSLYGLFRGCTSLESFDKGDAAPYFTTSGTCGSMFSGCTSLSRVNTSFFQNCKRLSYMFAGCTALTEIDTSNFGAAERIIGIFQGCSGLTEIDATPFENVTEAGSAFAGTGITSIDISSMKSVTRAESMFENCAGLAEIHGWDLPREAAIDNIFKGCSSLEAVHVIEAPPVDSGEWHLIHVQVSPDGSTADIVIHSDGGEKTTVTGVSLADGAYGVVFPVAVDDLYVGDGTDLSEKIQEYLSERYPWSTRWQTDALDASKKNFVLWSRDTRSVRTNIFESGAVKVKGAVWND